MRSVRQPPIDLLEVENTLTQQLGLDFPFGSDWLLQSYIKQTNHFLKHKHMWCGFVLYKGVHSLLPNCFGDSVISNSPPLRYLCLACQSHWGAMKWQGTSNSFCPTSDSNRQAGGLNDFLKIAQNKKRLLHLHLWAGGRVGEEDWCSWRFCQSTASCLSHTRHPLGRANDLLSLKLTCPFISRRDVKGVTDEKWS